MAASGGGAAGGGGSDGGPSGAGNVTGRATRPLGPHEGGAAPSGETDLQWVVSGAAAGREEPDLERDTQVGEYRVSCKLGAGGMGDVYGAVHPLIDKRVAIKVLRYKLCKSPLMVQRFVAEARAVNRIGHPNIVDVFAFGTLPDGRHYSVMEWLRGETLSAFLARGRPPLAETLTILDDVCRALEAAHAEGIIHRDLKPDNVFLVEVRGERARVKLLDFGIAKLLVDEDSVTTREGQLLGTPAYISPEQACGRKVGPETDVYALGVMAYEMVCGRRPFVGVEAEVLARQLSDPPPRPKAAWRDIPPRLERLLLALLEKKTERRPSLAEVRRELAELRVAGERDAADRARARPGRRALLTVALAAGAAALVVGIAGRGRWFARPEPAAPVSLPVRAQEGAPATPAAWPAPAAGAPAVPLVAAEEKPAAAAAAAVARPAPARVRLSAERPADLYLDGKLLARSATEASAEVAPGNHRVEARMPGRRTIRKQVTAVEGQSLTVVLAGLGPAPRAATRKQGSGARSAAPAESPPEAPAAAPASAPSPPADPNRMIDPFKRKAP